MAERKRPRRTRERILETALVLFNGVGEPNVTTADIADEMEISPGNLYYHFHNKDDIIAELFAGFERRLDGLLTSPERRNAGVEDLWFLLHLLFEAMWDHRFLFRDLDEILSRNRRLASRFARIMRRGSRTMIELCRSLVATGAMEVSIRSSSSRTRGSHPRGSPLIRRWHRHRDRATRGRASSPRRAIGRRWPCTRRAGVVDDRPPRDVTPLTM